MSIYRKTKQALAYTRVSTDKQGEFGIGLEGQRAAIQAYADKMGIEVIEWFQDVASGRGEKNLTNRPGLLSALDMAKARDCDILVAGLDRLSRDTKTFEHIMRERMVTVQSVTDDPSSNEVVLASRAARAQREGEEISERTIQALGKLKAEGVKLGNRTNLPEAQRLGAEANKRRAEEKVYELAQVIRKNGWETLSVPALVTALNEIGIKTGSGKAWTTAALRRPHKAAMEALKTSSPEDYQDHPGYGAF